MQKKKYEKQTKYFSALKPRKGTIRSDYYKNLL